MRFRSVAARSALVAVAALSMACERTAPPHLPGAPRDDFGDTLALAHAPTRIVSLNPTTTEMLFALGAGSHVVGRTHWDAWPDSARLVPDLGNGLRPDVEKVLASKPDVVVLYASEDNRDAARELRAANVATLSLRINTPADFDRALLLLGRMLGDSARAALVHDSVHATLARVRAATASAPKPTVFWHVWDSPLITIGRGSYLNDLLVIAGGTNVYDDLAAPSPQVSMEDVLARNPEVILAGPEGKQAILKSAAWRTARAVRMNRVLVVDTNLVGRPSVRMGEAALQIARLLHPDLPLH